MLTDLLLQKLDENGYDIREGYQRFLELVNLAAGRPETPYIITLLLTIPYIRLIFRYAEILRLKHKMRPPRPKAVPVPAASRDDGNNTETFRNTGKRNVKKRRTPKTAVRMPRISFTTLLPLPIRVWRNLSLCIFRKKIAGTAMEFPDGGYLRVQKLGPHDQQDRKNESICSWNARNVIEIPADINEEGEDCIKFCYKDDRAFIVVSEDGKYLYHPLEKNVPLLLVKNIRELRNPQDDIPNYAVTWICGTAEGSAAGKER
ncbi:MAG: hypothetical protein IKU40_04530 [Clostridia bacterium]|nr:hypothetical protein [Clostridia bacterium]